MATRGGRIPKEHEAVQLPIWQELLVGIEVVYLRLSPVYWGFGVPQGDGAGVVVIPAFLGTDLYLAELVTWLGRIGYKAYYSGIGLNAECPNLLIRHRLSETIEKAYSETGRKVHLVGHSLGGVIARAIAAQMPQTVGSVIALGSPFRGVSAHSSILRAAEMVRGRILERHGEGVLPNCYTGKCTCAFLESLSTDLPGSVFQTAVYTKTDGLVDWKVCRTGKPGVDFEVTGTHLGLVFNPSVYEIMARRLAEGMPEPKKRRATPARRKRKPS
jgi:pimeloyl-ACP methyl ester carboxylesterase